MRSQGRKGQIMYPNNIYIKNYEVKQYPGDIGVPGL
jgi:hypothetical protein